MVYTLTYNAENRLTAISGGGVTASYTYDGDNIRRSQTTAGIDL